jgi:hypothetical protein
MTAKAQNLAAKGSSLRPASIGKTLLDLATALRQRHSTRWMAIPVNTGIGPIGMVLNLRTTVPLLWHPQAAWRQAAMVQTRHRCRFG